jgi:hypothetical protein
MISDEKIDQNQSCRSQWEVENYNFIVDDCFHLKSFDVLKVWVKLSQFKIQIYQTTSNGKTTKTKVVDLNENYNFVVDDFFIWIRLRSQVFISKS